MSAGGRRQSLQGPLERLEELLAGDDRVLKLFGISLAAGVFIDAFVVRSLLLPAVLHLLGRRTWALPAWLDRRLPHVAIDAEPMEEAG